MPDISAISHYPLKVIFAVHLVLVSWSLQTAWVAPSFALYNLLFLVCLLWAVHNSESDEPIQFALAINVISILLDIVSLSLFFPSGHGVSKFSGAMMIINLLVRVITSYSLLRIGQSRGGTIATIFPPGRGMDYSRQEYEDIPYPVPNNSDFTGI